MLTINLLLFPRTTLLLPLTLVLHRLKLKSAKGNEELDMQQPVVSTFLSARGMDRLQIWRPSQWHGKEPHHGCNLRKILATHGITLEIPARVVFARHFASFLS